MDLGHDSAEAAGPGLRRGLPRVSSRGAARPLQAPEIQLQALHPGDRFALLAKPVPQSVARRGRVLHDLALHSRVRLHRLDDAHRGVGGAARCLRARRRAPGRQQPLPRTDVLGPRPPAQRPLPAGEHAQRYPGGPPSGHPLHRKPERRRPAQRPSHHDLVHPRHRHDPPLLPDLRPKGFLRGEWLPDAVLRGHRRVGFNGV
mmetsp:Transcript_583/g.1265  ORF Transcript_583/g.1265 Transcript_583/m.1265 type:complete len:202 (-) Transcript_583:826-1431(-)